MLKTCLMCGEDKDITEFSPSKNNKDGVVSYCRPCKAIRGRIYSRSERGKFTHKRFRGTEKRKAWKLEHERKWRASHPEQVYARNAVQSAMEKGELIRPSYCTECGKECKPQAHHESYLLPLVVIWLCAPCHRNRHNQFIRVENGRKI